MHVSVIDTANSAAYTTAPPAEVVMDPIKSTTLCRRREEPQLKVMVFHRIAFMRPLRGMRASQGDLS